MVLPTNQCGHDSICVVVDRLTKHVHFLTTKSTIMAIDVSRLVLQTKKFDCMGCLKTSNMWLGLKICESILDYPT